MGCNAPDKIRLIKRCLDQVRPDIVFLQETKIEEEDFGVFSRKFQSWKFSLVGAQDASGGLVALWRDSVVEVDVIRTNRWWQWLKVRLKQLHANFFLINIYGPNNSNLKMQLWSELSDILRLDRESLFILGGDFNALLRPLDKMGGVGWDRQSHRDFSAFVMDFGLLEIPFRKGYFTWTNRRSGFLNISKRLDRFLIVGDWSESHWNCVAEILPIKGSYHYPICLRIQDDSATERCPFKFEAMWLRDSNIKNLVEQWWHHIPERPGNKAFIFFKKLQFLKEQFKKWNRESFSNIFNEKLWIEEELKILHEKIISQGMDEYVFDKELF